MMKKKLIKIQGFTLIEILIAIVITSLMMAAMFTSYTLVNSTYRQVADRAKISQAGRDTVGTMLREIRMAGFKYEGDDIYRNMQNYNNDCYENINVETIGIWMSGGADSSMLAYLLAKQIRDFDLNIKIQPLSVRRGRPNNPIYAGNVIDFIEEDLQIKMNDHIIYYPDINDEHQREIKEF